jgi:ribosome biogenesis GTPase
LNDGVFVIDSPGIQDFSLDKISIEDIQIHYSDFHSYIDKCRYKNCLHINENICGVKDALNQDEISILRYENYKNILLSI